MALDICAEFEKKLVMTGRSNGATGEQFGQYVKDTLADPDLEKKYNSFKKN